MFTKTPDQAVLDKAWLDTDCLCNALLLNRGWRDCWLIRMHLVQTIDSTVWTLWFYSSSSSSWLRLPSIFWLFCRVRGAHSFRDKYPPGAPLPGGRIHLLHPCSACWLFVSGPPDFCLVIQVLSSHGLKCMRTQTAPLFNVPRGRRRIRTCNLSILKGATARNNIRTCFDSVLVLKRFSSIWNWFIWAKMEQQPRHSKEAGCFETQSGFEPLTLRT